MICAASFVVWSGFGAILPYLPVFLQEQAHASMWLIGVVAASYYVGTFVFSAPLGRLSDSIGRKPVIVAGVALYAVATGLFVSTTHPGWFILFRLARGDRGGRAVTPAGQALVAELSTEETRSRAYGWYDHGSVRWAGRRSGAWPCLSTTWGAGRATGPSTRSSSSGARCRLSRAVLLLFTIKEPEHARRRREVKVARTLRTGSLITRPVVAFLVVAFTGNFAMGVWEVVWSLWLRHLGASMSFVG